MNHSASVPLLLRHSMSDMPSPLKSFGTTAAGIVMSICGPLWVSPESDKLALLPTTSWIVAPFKLTCVTASEATSVSLAATV